MDDDEGADGQVLPGGGPAGSESSQDVYKVAIESCPDECPLSLVLMNDGNLVVGIVRIGLQEPPDVSRALTLCRLATSNSARANRRRGPAHGDLVPPAEAGRPTSKDPNPQLKGSKCKKSKYGTDNQLNRKPQAQEAATGTRKLSNQGTNKQHQCSLFCLEPNVTQVTRSSTISYRSMLHMSNTCTQDGRMAAIIQLIVPSRHYSFPLKPTQTHSEFAKKKLSIAPSHHHANCSETHNALLEFPIKLPIVPSGQSEAQLTPYLELAVAETMQGGGFRCYEIFCYPNPILMLQPNATVQNLEITLLQSAGLL